jgi:hypothetical protein
MFTNYLLRHPLLHPLCGLRPGLFTTGNRESTIRRYRRIAGGHEVSTNRVRTEFNDRTYDYVLAHTREPEVRPLGVLLPALCCVSPPNSVC